MGRTALVVLVVVVLSTTGCLVAFDASTDPGDGPSTPTPAAGTEPESMSAADTGERSAAVPTSTAAEGRPMRVSSSETVFPPGTSEEGIENATVLLNAHTNTLVRTGFVVSSSANATVRETGMLIDGTTRGGARVAANGTAYRAYRVDAAGPFQRRSEGWYGGTIERHRRVTEVGRVHESDRERRSAGELAGRPLLAPHLEAGEFEVTAVERSDTGTLLTFAANGFDDESTLSKGLPEGTAAVRSYDATAVVDSEGRIRSFTATVEYTIGDRNATHHLEYRIERIDDVDVDRPEWVDG